MAASPESPLVFTARRRQPMLVAPAEVTPHEFKTLSDIDDQRGLRNYAPGVHFYGSHPSMAGRDPAEVVRSALAKLLVFYYPLAGRLREAPGGKLVVECTGEGAQFIEADADVDLDQFGTYPRPPFPCLEELIYGAEGPAAGFLDSPLLSFQVTRLRCGGFVFGHRINHSVADGAGTAQILNALSEIARGATSPSVSPVWARERLLTRDPPRVTHAHPAYDAAVVPALPGGEPVMRMFHFGPHELAALRQLLPPHQRATRFELLTACLWRSRTVALGVDPGDEVRLRFTFNGRSKCSPPLPQGYYGNALAYGVARARAAELIGSPVGYALELVREAKESITEGYMESAADFLVLHGRPAFNADLRTFLVSDVTRVGFYEVDFGWGEPAYAGPAVGGGRVTPRLRSHYVRSRNVKGEEGILVPIHLPAPAMERFVAEMERLAKEQTGATPPELCSVVPSMALSTQTATLACE